MAITDAHPDLNRTLQYFPVENENPATLSKAQIQHFNENGFLSPLDALSDDEIAQHREYFNRLMEKVLAEGGNSYSINGWHTRSAGIHDLTTDPRILDYVQDLLGENLICWGTHYFCKLPGEDKQVSWHQDASYWPLSPSKTVTVWLAIDDAYVENGAMTVIPKSHLHGQIAFERSSSEEKNVLNQTVIEPDQYGDAPVPFEMKAGQLSLHSDLLLHGSEPNTSDRRRCGLTMRFVPPEVKAANNWNQRAIIARGSDPSGHWAHNPRPKDDVLPTTLTA